MTTLYPLLCPCHTPTWSYLNCLSDPDSTSYGWSVRITGKIGDDTDVTEKAQTAGLTSDQQHTHSFGRIRQRHDIWRHGKERHDIAIRHGTAYPGHDIAIRHGTAYPGTTVRGTARHIPAPWCAASLFTAWHAARRCATIRHGMTRGTMVRDNTARHDDTTCGTMVRDNTNEYGTKHGTIRYAARWRATIRTNTARDMARNTIRGTTVRDNTNERIRNEIRNTARDTIRGTMVRVGINGKG